MLSSVKANNLPRSGEGTGGCTPHPGEWNPETKQSLEKRIARQREEETWRK